MSLSNFPANLAQTPSSAVIPQAPQQPVSSGQPAREAQPQPTMANKAPATEVTTNSVPASVAKAVTLPLFRVVLSPTITRPFYAVPRTSVARTASG